MVEAVQHRIGHQSVRAERGRHQNPLCACKFGDAIGDPTVGEEPGRDDQPGGAATAQNVGGIGQRRLSPGGKGGGGGPPRVIPPP